MSQQEEMIICDRYNLQPRMSYQVQCNLYQIIIRPSSVPCDQDNDSSLLRYNLLARHSPHTDTPHERQETLLISWTNTPEDREERGFTSLQENVPILKEDTLCLVISIYTKYLIFFLVPNIFIYVTINCESPPVGCRFSRMFSKY